MMGPNATAPGMFAQLATAYSAKHNIPMERIKEAMTHISWKSHQNGAKNPRAHLRKAIHQGADPGRSDDRLPAGALRLLRRERRLGRAPS